MESEHVRQGPLRGTTIGQIIPILGPNQPEKAKIFVKGASDQDLPIENTLIDENGEGVTRITTGTATNF
jgi:hypothetical protein